MKTEEEWDIGQMQLFLRLNTYNNLTSDGLNITNQAVNFIIQGAIRKIKTECANNADLANGVLS